MRGFLDLVRLGVKAPSDPYVADSIAETDASLATDTPSGRVWHRYTFDGYGEKPDGSPWQFNTPGTKGRAWPLLGGERGEYEVANGRNGLPYLRTMANTANDGYMIPEQVWDKPQPAPAPYDYQPGKATGSASPLAWAMAQYVRLAQAIGAGRPVETPDVVRGATRPGAQRALPTLDLTPPATARSPTSKQVDGDAAPRTPPSLRRRRRRRPAVAPQRRPLRGHRRRCSAAATRSPSSPGPPTAAQP